MSRYDQAFKLIATNREAPVTLTLSRGKITYLGDALAKQRDNLRAEGKEIMAKSDLTHVDRSEALMRAIEINILNEIEELFVAAIINSQTPDDLLTVRQEDDETDEPQATHPGVVV